MFKQIKSIVFWSLLYKFRKRVTLVSLLLFSALFSQFIYSDIVEYLKLKEQIDYLDYILPLKWIFILFCITSSVFLLLSLFKKEEVKEVKNKNKKIKKDDKEFSKREEKFLNKKVRNQAEILLDK
ncbi:hypothetical protein CP965_06625 [Halarcobacter mediterraneus]|uniref:Uncharacterized protein n=1 Tax=Halarcobacter mediterraneus TaxID=2023153 RepID=A0A4Q1AU89_9BACT|nr:hypothetical protein [Halarcobacter mediterraneus]RXK13472.1 hypothetical protein CP965_06625 [Halarcobacter mediterraneus]